MRYCAYCAVFAALVGCGGGAGSIGNPGNPGGSQQQQTSTVGSMHVTYSGIAKPLVTASSGSVSTYGQAGAAYSELVYVPTHNLADTYLVVTRSVGVGGTIAKLPYTGGSETPLLTSALSYAWTQPSCSVNLIAALDTNTGHMWTMNSDGTGLARATTGSVSGYAGALSPTAPTVVMMSNQWLYSIPYGGSTETQIGFGPQTIQTSVAGPISFFSSGTEAAFCALDANQIMQVYTTPTNSSANAVDVTPTYLQGTNLYSVAVSPNGADIVASGFNTTNYNLYDFNLLTGSVLGLSPAKANDYYPTFSPDGSMMAFYRTGSTFQSGIYVSNYYGENAYMLEADPTGTNVNGLAWSPFLPNKTFVGSGGRLINGSADGYVMGLNDNRFSSLLAFVAKTPADATVTAPSSTTGGNSLIYTIGADSITEIAYTNVYSGLVTTFAPNVPSAVVSIDGYSGQIDVVAEALATPKASTTPARAVYDGKFSAIYDSKGKNLAPSGASHLEFDRKSGKLLTFHA